jgi:hypothetical protein
LHYQFYQPLQLTPRGINNALTIASALTMNVIIAIINAVLTPTRQKFAILDLSTAVRSTNRITKIPSLTLLFPYV